MSMAFFPPAKQDELNRARRKGQSVSQGDKYGIEGEYVTRRQIGDRLGLTLDQVRRKMNRLAKLPEPITWEKLK